MFVKSSNTVGAQPSTWDKILPMDTKIKITNMSGMPQTIHIAMNFLGQAKASPSVHTLKDDENINNLEFKLIPKEKNKFNLSANFKENSKIKIEFE